MSKLNHLLKKEGFAIVTFAAVLALLASNSGLTAFANGSITSLLTEYITISVDCTMGRLDLACTIQSTNSTLVHYPNPVYLSDPHLVNCTSITATFSKVDSMLLFQFNDTSKAIVEDNAAAVISSMNTAFGLTFMFNASVVISMPSPYVTVTYKATAKADLSAFLGDLKTNCFGTDVGGFSNVLPTLFAQAENETISIMAVNVTSDWTYTFLAEYDTAFPAGSGNHTVDVLHYLGTSTLQPSPYAWFSIYYYYMSYVRLTIHSSETIYFVSCHPAEVTGSYFNPGWYVPTKSGQEVTGTLYFGNSIPEWNIINFTFDGNIIPEYSPIPLVFLITFVSATVLYLRKRMKIAT